MNTYRTWIEVQFSANDLDDALAHGDYYAQLLRKQAECIWAWHHAEDLYVEAPKQETM